MAEGFGKGSAGPMFPSNTPRPKPKSLLEAISDIEKLSAVERTGNPIPQSFLLLNEKIGYFDVGLKGGLADIPVALIFVPLSVGVIERAMPIFGTTNPTTFDEFFSMLIGISFMLGYNILMAFNLGSCFFGAVCRNAIWQLYGGFVTGSVMKMIVVFFTFHFLYLKVTPELISHVLTAMFPFAKILFTIDQWDTFFYWLCDMRNALFKSGYFVVVSTIVGLGIPAVSFVIGSRRATREDELKRKYDAI